MTTRRKFVFGSLASLAAIPCISSPAGAAITPTCRLMIAYLAKVTKRTGEIPQFAVMGMGTWAKLAEDFKPQEFKPDSDRFSRTDDGYLAIEIAGVPFCALADCEEGKVILVHPDNPNACGTFVGLEFLDI
jgi:hypothetical protein